MKLFYLTFFMCLSTLLFAQEEQVEREREAEMLYKALKLKQEQARLNREEAQSVMEFYQQKAPEIAEKLSRLKKQDLPYYNSELRHLYHDKIMLERIKEIQPERFAESLEMRKLDSRSRELSRKYLESDEQDEKEDIEQELRDTLNELFELREKERKLEMQRISEKLKKLENETQLRRENKEQIVENRIKELTGQKSVFEW